MDLPTTERNNVNWHTVKKTKQPEPHHDTHVASTTIAAIQESYPFKMNVFSSSHHLIWCERSLRGLSTSSLTVLNSNN